MGTNYYLVHKTAKDHWFKLDYDRGFSPYVFHIGKSSYGWFFTLCQYQDDGLMNLYDWNEKFKDRNYTIYNEYNKKVKRTEMLEIISKRKGDVTEKEYNKLLKEKHIEENVQYDKKHKLLYPIDDDRFIYVKGETYVLTKEANFC